MSDDEIVTALQERTARAQPAEHGKDARGWWLRHAPGCSWWLSATLPHGAVEQGELAGRIAEVEDFYAAHDAPVRFQITPGACPDALDALLEERGYLRKGELSLQVAPTARVGEHTTVPGTPHVRMAERPSRAWFEAWRTARGGGGDRRAEWDMLARTEQPSGYASALLGDEIVAVGRVVSDTGWAGVFGMATLPRARGKGAARAVLATLANWAATHGADDMYLQVELDNDPAIRLYARAGFIELRHFHYRFSAGQPS